jgi:hypothetical protein
MAAPLRRLRRAISAIERFDYIDAKHPDFEVQEDAHVGEKFGGRGREED